MTNIERGEDLGWITKAGNKEEMHSVTWINFPGAPVTGYEMPDPGTYDEYSVPVSTEELVRQGVDIEEGTFVWASVKLEAQMRSEIDPRDFRQLAPMTPEAEAAWISGE